MNKMKLQLDDLQVESFAVQGDEVEPGTIRGLEVDTGIHSQCYTHCKTDCEGSCACESQQPTHCNADETCFSWDGITCFDTDCPMETCDQWACTGFC